MNIDMKKMENLSYEQPSLKKYGTMKEFTLGSGGSFCPINARCRNDTNIDPIRADNDVPGIFNNKSDPVKVDGRLDA